MSEERRLSEEMQSAFVDGQLEADDWAKIAARLDGEPGLREDVCRLRALKDMVRHAYEAPPPPPARSWRTAGRGWKSLVAAAIVFALLGWFGRAEWDRAPALDAASAYALSGDWQALRGNWRAADGAKVLVHVSTGGHEALGNALDEVEDLLHEAGASHRRIQVEIVANGGGLDLLRASDPDFPQRLEAMRRENPGLRLVACGQTLERRRASGRPLELVPGTVVAPSALQQVVERLREGWIYVRA